MFKRLLWIIALMVGLHGLTAGAAEEVESINNDQSNPSPSGVVKVLQHLIPDAKPDRVAESAIPGMYEVTYGSEIFYITQDGRFILQGDLLNTETRENLTEAIRSTVRLKLINQLDANSMIVFAPKQVKHTVTIFTDVDCSFCRKLHSQIADYNKYGIAIRYLAFPRTGVDTESYFKAVAVWCAADRQAALTRAKQGEVPKRKSCDNPVREHMALADRLGVTATPTLILEDGSLVSGYIPPAQMSQMLEQVASSK